jgi:hypothetical protein
MIRDPRKFSVSVKIKMPEQLLKKPTPTYCRLRMGRGLGRTGGPING